MFSFPPRNFGCELYFIKMCLIKIVLNYEIQSKDSPKIYYLIFNLIISYKLIMEEIETACKPFETSKLHLRGLLASKIK